MSDSSNPFAAPDKRTTSSRAATAAICTAMIMTIAAAVVGVLWYQHNVRQKAEIESLRSKLKGMGDELFGAIAANRDKQELLGFLTNQIVGLQKEKEQVGHAAKTLEEEMRQQLESKDVTISKLQGKLTVSIVDRVMFDSGEAILKPDGAAVMEKIAALLATHPGLNIHVIGHTDNIPIRQNSQARFASNWELSAARALAAVHFLTEKAGVDPRRVGAVGYGEYLPIADNSTAEGRAKNRRIEVAILPNEIAAADATTAGKIPGPSEPSGSEGAPATRP